MFLGNIIFELSDAMATSIVDISQINMEGLIRDIEEEEVMRLLKQMMENNMIILKLQKQFLKLQEAEKEKRRREQEREWRRREYNKRWEEEEQKGRKERKEEERKRIDDEWRRVEEIRIKEERRTKKEWKQQEVCGRRREVNRKRAMIERKCFVCRMFGYIACNCINVESRREEGSTPMPLNKFEVLKSRVMNVKEGSGKEIRKDRKMILRKERLKEGKKGNCCNSEDRVKVG